MRIAASKIRVAIEITSLFISGKHHKKFQNSELGEVLGKTDTTKKKYKELKEQVDKIIMNHDGSNFLITVHFKLEFEQDIIQYECM